MGPRGEPRDALRPRPLRPRLRRQQGPDQAADDPPRRRPRPRLLGRGRRPSARAPVGNPRRRGQDGRGAGVAPPDQRGALSVPEADADRLPHQQHRLVLALVGALRCARAPGRELLRPRAVGRRDPRRLRRRRRQQRERGEPCHRIPAAGRGAEPAYRALRALGPAVAARRRRPGRDPDTAWRRGRDPRRGDGEALECAGRSGPVAGGVPQFRRGAGVAPVGGADDRRRGVRPADRGALQRRVGHPAGRRRPAQVARSSRVAADAARPRPSPARARQGHGAAVPLRPPQPARRLGPRSPAGGASGASPGR